MRKAAMILVMAMLAAATASAQYFGGNKVQYETFDFRVIRTQHFDIYFYPEEASSAQLASRMAERWYTRLSSVLHHELSGRQPLILYAAHPHFQQTNAIPGEIGEGTGGVTEALKRRIVLPFAGGLAETDHVLGHELVHAFQYDMASRVDAAGDAAGPAVMLLPLWFIEGMAEYLSLGPVDANTAMWIRDASSRDKMPTVEKLDDPDFFPYRYGHAFWAYVGGRWGDEAIGDLLRATGPRGDVEGAMQGVLGLDTKMFTAEWHDATRRTYAPFFETTQGANAFGRALITEEMNGGRTNVAPSLSPDGRRFVFLSERSMFSIDMYVADVGTGRVTRKLIETAGDPHFDSLQFINSAGDWAPDNQRFVFSALSAGQPVVTIVNVDNGSRERDRTFPDLDEIFNPAWSPDGQQIAFSAIKGGVLDLYVMNVADGSLKALTDDAYADLDPEWTPDGGSLAWVTDRFSSNIGELDFGNYRIGLINVRTGDRRPLAGFETGRNTNPEFSSDGRTLYFIATPDGIPNIYRVAAAGGGTAVRVTNVLSGISGITPLTPALSVASKAQGVLFSAYEDDNYNIYFSDMGAALPAARNAGVDRDAAALPPFNRRSSEIARLLQAPATGLPPQTEYPEERYKAKLSLDQIGQPTVGVGADRFGAYAAGGLSLMFSDMLGNHTFGATLQVSNRLAETGGAVGYFNRESRWNWGVVGDQTPYVTGSFSEGITTSNGSLVGVQETHRIIQIDRGVSGIAQYPFSRAQRVEFSAGVRQISFDQELETQLFSLSSGSLVNETREDLPRPDAVNLGTGSAALVYDTSVFGATGPIVGRRYRFEYSQTGGSLLYSGALADVRQYFMPARPFTIALRGLHYGRYGRDGEDLRLSPMYLGNAGLVRGYDIGSFDASECGVSATGACNVFDQLVGSRIAVANAELRFPLFGVFSRRSFYGPLPIEVAFFGDAGKAWTTSGGEALFGNGNRDWVRSAGAALRMNAFGYAILELDYVRPLDRPGRGWMWQFNLTPGF